MYIYFMMKEKYCNLETDIYIYIYIWFQYQEIEHVFYLYYRRDTWQSCPTWEGISYKDNIEFHLFL
jgi:hypothetical protein